MLKLEFKNKVSNSRMYLNSCCPIFCSSRHKPAERKKLEIVLFSTAAANRFVHFIRVFKVFSAVNGTGCCIAKRKGGGGMAAVEGRKRRMAWHRAFFVDWVHRYVAHCDYVSAWNQVCRFPFLRRLCAPAHLMNVFFQRHAVFRGIHREISIPATSTDLGQVLFRHEDSMLLRSITITVYSILLIKKKKTEI